MARYDDNPIVRNDTTDAGGTRTAQISPLARGSYQMDRTGRMPAFAGLAANSGGYYAENDGGMTLPEAMKACGMNFDVRMQEDIEIPLITEDGVANIKYPHRGTYAAWEDGTRVGLGMVKNRYQIVQPTEAGELGQALMDMAGANVVAAGIYGNPQGAKSYLAFNLPEGLTIGGVDRHDLYLTILNSYDGSSGLTGLFAPIRLACTNMTTVTFGRRVANRFTFRHTGDIVDKLKAAREALGVADEWTQAWKIQSEKLLATTLTDVELAKFVGEVLPTPSTVKTANGVKGWDDKRLQLRSIITQSDTCEFGRGTAYAALQGVHEWADWFSATQKGGKDGAIARFTRTLDGASTEAIKLSAGVLLGL